jgi:hypothetical protein
MLHRLHPRRPSRLPQWVATVAATAAALFLVLFGPPSQAGGRANVAFVDPQRFSDVARTVADRERELRSLQAHFDRRAAGLPDGQSLRVEVIDVDLAGTDYPMMFQHQGGRVLSGRADGPRIELRWALLDRGQVLRAGEDRLTDPGYLFLSRRQDASDGDLPYEKRMIDAWFADRFGIAAR